MFGLEEPWSLQIIQRIIPWWIILDEGFLKLLAPWKVTSLLCWTRCQATFRCLQREGFQKEGMEVAELGAMW